MCIWIISHERVDVDCNFWGSLPFKTHHCWRGLITAPLTRFVSERKRTLWKKEKMLKIRCFFFSHFQNELYLDLGALHLSDQLAFTPSCLPVFHASLPFSWSRIIAGCNHYGPFFVFFNFILLLLSFSPFLCVTEIKAYFFHKADVVISHLSHQSQETKWHWPSTSFSH